MRRNWLLRRNDTEVFQLVLVGVITFFRTRFPAKARLGEKKLESFPLSQAWQHLYEHLDEIRRTYKLRECGWREYLWLSLELLPQAMESDLPIPLIEHALELLRTEGILAPVLTHLERFVWIVLTAAEKRLFRMLTAALTLKHRSRLDGLLHTDAGCVHHLDMFIRWYPLSIKGKALLFRPGDVTCVAGVGITQERSCRESPGDPAH